MSKEGRLEGVTYNRYSKNARSTLILDEETNPCTQEHALSMRCLDRNSYDKSKCEMYFQNYNNCKEFWGRVMSDRRRNGTYPLIPLPKDREEVKKEYKQKFNL